jgi:hypothetical protein
MLEAGNTSETSVYFHENTRRNIAESCHLNSTRLHDIYRKQEAKKKVILTKKEENITKKGKKQEQ